MDTNEIKNFIASLFLKITLKTALYAIPVGAIVGVVAFLLGANYG